MIDESKVDPYPWPLRAKPDKLAGYRTPLHQPPTLWNGIDPEQRYADDLLDQVGDQHAT